MKVTVRKYFNNASIEDAIEKMAKKGIKKFKAYDIISFDADGPCWVELKEYKVKKGVIVSTKNIDITPELYPPYQENGGGVVVELKLTVKFNTDEEWMRKEFKKYAKKHISLSDYPKRITKIKKSESVYAYEDTEDGCSYKWVAGAEFSRVGRKVIVSRHDYCI